MAKKVEAVLEVEAMFAATPEKVFDAWLDPEKLKLWFCGPDLFVSLAEVDPKVGGAYTIVMSNQERSWNHSGTYLAIDRPRRLVFTWFTPSTDYLETLVTVTFKPEGGGTRLRLVHEQVPEKTFDGHRKGWGELIQNLDQLLR